MREMAWFSPLLSVSVLSCVLLPGFCSEHSLFYTYTALSKPLSLPGIYEFTALGMLDDRELDYYTSETQVKVPKQNWMREKMQPDYWEKGTQSRKSKEQWFKVNVDILMERMRHNKTDLHVLQWRHGCVIKNGAGADVTFLRGIDEYSYDGDEFLSFDEENSRWIAPVQAAEPTKRKWDDVPILNQYTKGYLEKECVDWLTKFMDYGQEEMKKHYPPDVRMFAKKSVADPDKLTLTCMATGFYPKDIEMNLRKYRTSLPEHLVTSSGVRPNGDGTYQLRKSVEIKPEDKALYNCYVNHITLKEPIIINPGEDIPCLDCTVPKIQSGIIGGVIGLVVALAVVAGVLFILKKKGIITLGSQSNHSANMVLSVVQPLLNGSAPAPAPAPAPASAQAPAPAPALVSAPAAEKKENDSSNDSGNSSSSSTNSSQDNITVNHSNAGSNNSGSQQDVQADEQVGLIQKN